MHMIDGLNLSMHFVVKLQFAVLDSVIWQIFYFDARNLVFSGSSILGF